MQAEGAAVRPVQLRDGIPAQYATGVAGDGDDVLEDDIVGQHVEVVVAVDEPVDPLLDDGEERLEGFEVFTVVHDCPRLSRLRPHRGPRLDLNPNALTRGNAL